ISPSPSRSPSRSGSAPAAGALPLSLPVGEPAPEEVTDDPDQRATLGRFGSDPSVQLDGDLDAQSFSGGTAGSPWTYPLPALVWLLAHDALLIIRRGR